MTFLLLLRRISAPQTSLLGRRPGTEDFVALSRNPEAEPLDRTLIFRADSGWFYANAPVMEVRLTEAMEAMPEPPSLVIIDMATAPMVDLGVMDTLAELSEDLHHRGVRLEFAYVYAAVAERLQRYSDVFATVHPNESIDAILDRIKEQGHGNDAQGARAMAAEGVERRDE
ncbi:MAG: STAS domain-containing protein [Thermomicrobiales bacterium]